jgi:hypothetical protein
MLVPRAASALRLARSTRSILGWVHRFITTHTRTVTGRVIPAARRRAARAR